MRAFTCLVAASVISCASGTDSLLGAASDGTARLMRARPVDQPALTVLVREGDPSVGAAVAIRTDADGLENAAFAFLLTSRLQKENPRIELWRGGVLLLDDLTEDEAPRWIASIRAALASAITPEEASVALERARDVPLPPSTPELEDLRSCTLEPSVTQRKVEPSDLERVRRTAFVADHVSIGFVGAKAPLLALSRGYDGQESWPTVAQPIATAMIGSSARVSVVPDLTDRETRVHFAVRTGDGAGALTAAKRLSAPDSPLRAMLSRLAPSASASEVRGTSGLSAGCVTLTLRLEGEPSRAVLDATFGVIEREISSAKVDMVAVDRDIAMTSDARLAALKAAWWSLKRAPHGESSVNARWLVLDVPPSRGDKATVAAASASLEASLSAETQAPSLKVQARRELGQPEVWVLLGSRCATSNEPAHQWGSLALLAFAASRHRADEVSLLPWLSSSGVGVIAHGPARERETPEEHSARIAGIAARALLVAPPDANDHLAAQLDARAEVESRWGVATPGLEAFARQMDSDHPSTIELLGSAPLIVRHDAALASRTWSQLSRNGLSLAILENSDAAQAAAATAEVIRYIDARPPEPCTVRSTTSVAMPNVTHGGELTRVFVALPFSMNERGAAMTLASLLEDPAARSAIGFEIPNLRVVRGASGLYLYADVSPVDGERTGSAIVRGLTSVAQGEKGELDLVRASQTSAQRERRELSDPAVRVGRLFAEMPLDVASSDAATTRAFLRETIASGKLRVVSVATP